MNSHAATTLTSWHLLVTFCSLHVALKLRFFEHKPFERKAVMGFGILNGISIGLLNLSLGFNSVGFYQVIFFFFVCVCVFDFQVFWWSWYPFLDSANVVPLKIGWFLVDLILHHPNHFGLVVLLGLFLYLFILFLFFIEKYHYFYFLYPMVIHAWRWF